MTPDQDLNLVYIAAPYGAPTKAGIARNTLRALALGRLASLTGLAPVVVHPSLSRLYGADDDPEIRAFGLRCSCAIVDGIAALANSELWILAHSVTDKSAQVSDGCKAEAQVWLARRSNAGIKLLTWDGYADLAARYGLADEWARLAP